MMNLESNVKDCIAKEIEKGIIEKVIAEKLESCIADAIEGLFKWNGPVKEVIEEKVKSVMIPYLESYNYSEYITKLDNVLVDVLKSSALENKKLLENFKELMTVNKIPTEVKLTDIFKKWCDYCEEKIDKYDLEYECGNAYITLNYEVEEVSSGWSDYEKLIVTFECEEDEKLNIEFMLRRWKKYDKEFTLDWDKKHELKSLRYLSEFDMFMMNIDQAYCKIEVDEKYDSEERMIEYEG